jgi:sec-independent protein translocase protein TatC
MPPVTQGTFFEHLDELRQRLIVALSAFFLAAVVPFIYSDRLLDTLIGPLLADVPHAYFFSPADAFVVKIKVSLLAAAVLSAPVMLGQLWLFISPALYGNEKKAVVPLIAITTGLFSLGCAFAFFQVVPVTLHFLLGMQTEALRPMVSISEYLSFLTSMVVAFGIAFNLPVFVLALVGSGLVSARQLNDFQRYAVLLIFIAAAVLTPGPDVASQLLLAVPMLVLFELSVLGAVLLEKMRARSARTVAR